MSQIPLPLDLKDQSIYKEEDFCLLPENSSCNNFLKKFFSQNNFEIPSLIIKGPEFSGKTHLINIFAKKYNAEFLNKDEISDLNLIDHLKKGDFYILEDINQIKDEKSLFHLLNSAFEAQAFLILTIENEFKFKLKDLLSRLRNIYVAKISELSLESAKMLLLNYFSRKQINISSKIIDYIVNNVARDYAVIFDSAKKVDFYVQESGKNITLREVRSFL